MGMIYKLNAYFAHLGMAFAENSLVLKFLVVALAAVEFVLGIYVLLGIHRRFTSLVVILIMMAMTLLTGYVYVYNPVPDCGCFGEAITLTNAETLLKNVVLLAASLVIFTQRRYMHRLISERNQWLTSIYARGYIILLALFSLHYLPPIDFTAYQKSTNLRKAWYGEAEGTTPDELLALSFFDDDGNDYTETLLNDTGYTFLLTLSAVDIADDGCNDRINDLHDECLDRNVPFYAVVGDYADSLAVNDWIDRTGAAYPFLKCDAVQLKAMVRSNPGLLLLKDGVLLKKWSNNGLPEVNSASAWSGIVQEQPSSGNSLLRLVLWFVVPLGLIILIDGLWIGSKYYKHYIFKKSLKLNDNEKENRSR